MIYLDHNATTPLRPEAQEAMFQTAQHAWANPGSRHAAGRAARKVLEQAREQIAQMLGATPPEVIFTSGGTESTNLALGGFSQGRSGRFLTLPGEHPATAATLQALVQQGWEREEIPLLSSGQLCQESLALANWERLNFVTALLAHNETGVIQRFGQLRELCHDHRLPWHVDAVQAVGKIPVNFRELGCTTLALGAHKFGGPRGIGALLVRAGVKLPPLLRGGHQEQGLRAGTEPVMLVAGMAAALQVAMSELDECTIRSHQWREELAAGLLRFAAPAVILGTEAPRLPNTLMIAFPGCTADALVVALDLAGVCCSVGSACASGSTQPSPILTAMGCPPEVIRSAIRLSLGWTNTPGEIAQAVEQISHVVASLRRKVSP